MNMEEINILSRKEQGNDVEGQQPKEIKEYSETHNPLGENMPDLQYVESNSRQALFEQNRYEFQLAANNEAKEDKHEGLTEEEKTKIKEAHPDWPDEIIEAIGSWKEYEIYDKANLKVEYINGKPCLVRTDIDMEQKDDDGLTNRQRMERGLPPITKDGKSVELHHIGQKSDSPLAELTTKEHRGTGNDAVLHDKTKESEINRVEFNKERREHWKSRTTEN